MQSLWNAAAAAGGLAFVGSLIDFILSRQKKAALKSALEDWWLRFDDMKWRNFGRKEAEAAVAVLDSWAGPRLWSWKRWRFSLALNLLCGFLATCISSVLVYSALAESQPHWGIVWAGLAIRNFAMYPSLVVTFAFSLSLTRWIAVFAGHLYTGSILDAVVFFVLLVMHWLLWCLWSPVSYLLQSMPIWVIAALAGYAEPIDLELIFPFIREMAPHLAGGWFPIPHNVIFEPTLLDFLYTMMMDAIANGLRIFFALAFFGSFLFRPLIQKPISWLWLRVLESNLPVFTVVFGIAGGLLKFGYSLLG